MGQLIQQHKPIIGVLDSWGSITDVLDIHGAQVIDIDYKHELMQAIPNVDALIFTGGGDINPERYNMKMHPRMYGTSGARDTLEFLAVKLAKKYKVPMMGICRGHQLLNVAHGGTLIQHLGDMMYTHAHQGGSHPVKVRTQSKVGRFIGAVVPDATTLHHQAVDRLGDGLVPVGWATDGTVEMLESAFGHKPYVLGVQFHPEMDFAQNKIANKIFKFFVNVARNKSIGRGDLAVRWDRVENLDSVTRWISKNLGKSQSTHTYHYNNYTEKYEKDDFDDTVDWEWDSELDAWKRHNRNGLRDYFAAQEAYSLGQELDCVATGGSCSAVDDCSNWGDCAAAAVQRRDKLLTEGKMLPAKGVTCR